MVPRCRVVDTSCKREPAGIIRADPGANFALLDKEQILLDKCRTVDSTPIRGFREPGQLIGAAAARTRQIVLLLDSWPVLALQIGIALLSTAFSLVMSNVGATVLLVSLAVSISVAACADPALFAPTVAISTSNSFIIPTHQVNALIMGPAGYKVSDFVLSGGIVRYR